MNPLIAVCGLDCSSCQARKATVENDQALREEVAKNWSELNHADITPEMINCLGCRVDGPKTPFCESLCPIRQCALSKKVDSCAECLDMMTCKKAAMILGNNSEARKRLIEAKIRLEREMDHRPVEELTREAFWNVYRPGCFEHLVLNRLRQQPYFVKELDLLIEKEGVYLAHIAYSKASISKEDGTKEETLIFGPFSVHPSYQKQGYGSALVAYSLEKAKELGFPFVLITGNPEYYSRFGFEPASKYGIHYEGMPKEEEAPFFMIKVFDQSRLVQGIYSDPPVFFVEEKDLEEFDASFPKKEKKKLPGQLC